MEIFTSLMANILGALHGADSGRKWDEGERETGREAQGWEREQGMHYMAGCDRLCLHEACDVLYNVWVCLCLCVHCTVYMWADVCFWNCTVFTGWGAGGCMGEVGGAGAGWTNRELESGPWAYCLWGPRGPRAKEGSRRVSCPVCFWGPLVPSVPRRVQVCVDLSHQRTVSKETGVCSSYPGGKLCAAAKRPDPDPERPLSSFLFRVRRTLPIKFHFHS